MARRQSVAMIQLAEDVADAYRTCPVVLDFKSGFYVFPVRSFLRKSALSLLNGPVFQPNDQHIVKAAIHTTGYTHASASGKGVSTPRTTGSNGNDGLRIPKVAVQAMRRALRGVYPDLANQPFSGTRLCW
jgi:sarcosine oxidase / L-pipecolate oxidase